MLCPACHAATARCWTYDDGHGPGQSPLETAVTAAGGSGAPYKRRYWCADSACGCRWAVYADGSSKVFNCVGDRAMLCLWKWYAPLYTFKKHRCSAMR